MLIPLSKGKGQGMVFVSLFSNNFCEQIPGQHGSNLQDVHFSGSLRANRDSTLGVFQTIKPDSVKFP